MTKRWSVWVLGLLVLATAAMIFYFSAQNGDESSETSNQVTVFLLRLLKPGFSGMTRRQRLMLIEKYGHIVRKGAHFTEFFLLGLFLRMLLQRLPVKWKTAISWIGGTVYAATDELHQMVVASRAAMALDVGIDSAGVLAGVLTVLLMGALFQRRRGRKAVG